MKKKIRTMIVEDHFVVRVGLAAIINSQPDMVNIAGDRGMADRRLTSSSSIDQT